MKVSGTGNYTGPGYKKMKVSGTGNYTGPVQENEGLRYWELYWSDTRK